MAWKLHAIEQTQLRRQHRVDGGRRLQSDFHTGAKHKSWDRVAAEAARTVPGRENGGNCDIKNLSRGCAVYLPVFVPGANLSMGDMHFSQGDGEVSFCGAIEMSGWLDLKCTVLNSAYVKVSWRTRLADRFTHRSSKAAWHCCPRSGRRRSA